MNLQYGTNAMSSHLENHTFSIGQDSQLLCSLTQLLNVSYTLLLSFPLWLYVLQFLPSRIFSFLMYIVLAAQNPPTQRKVAQSKPTQGFTTSYILGGWYQAPPKGSAPAPWSAQGPAAGLAPIPAFFSLRGLNCKCYPRYSLMRAE